MTLLRGNRVFQTLSWSKDVSGSYPKVIEPNSKREQKAKLLFWLPAGASWGPVPQFPGVWPSSATATLECSISLGFHEISDPIPSLFSLFRHLGNTPSRCALKNATPKNGVAGPSGYS